MQILPFPPRIYQHLFINYLRLNRFKVCACSNNAWMTSKHGTNKEVCYKPQASNVPMFSPQFDFLHALSVYTYIDKIMLSICFKYYVLLFCFMTKKNVCLIKWEAIVAKIQIPLKKKILTSESCTLTPSISRAIANYAYSVSKIMVNEEKG